MVLPRSQRDQRRHPLPGVYPEDQPRPPGERHPKEEDPLPFRARSSLPDAQRAEGGRPQALLASSSQKALALHKQRASRRLGGAARFRAAHHRPTGLPASVGTGHRLDDVRLHHALRREDALPQVLRVAVPRKGRALPLLQLAYDRDRLPPERSQNQIEQDALLAVVEALPKGVRPVVLADRGFCRAGFLRWLEYRNLDYVVRLAKGACITEPDGKRWKLGEEELRLGELRFCGGVRYGLYHGRPRELFVNVALCWRLPKGQKRRDPRCEEPAEPWYLATSLGDAKSAASWYRQRGWIEQSFKDSKSRFGLARVQVRSPERLSRLLAGLTIALSWLTLMALPGIGAMPKRWHAVVAQRGRASVVSLALALLDHLGNLPLACLPRLSR
jgi:hypothetical protein